MSLATSLKIFIVDDDLFYVELLKKHIENMGYQNISCFNTTEDIIKKIDEEPHIVILDHNIDTITGLELLVDFKEKYPDIFYLFLSSQEEIEVGINALKKGAFNYIIKDEDAFKNIETSIYQISIRIHAEKQGNKFLGKLNNLFNNLLNMIL